jgi:hypothetical protein
MPIHVTCICGKRYRIADRLIGQSRPCALCGATVVAIADALPSVIPVPDPEIADEIAEPSPAEPSPPKTIGPFGISSFVFAMLALLICWVPILNLAALPLALIGAILALLGIILAIVGKRYHLVWPASSLAMCVLSIVLFHQIWIRIFAFADTASAAVKQVGNAAEKATSGPIQIRLGP